MIFQPFVRRCGCACELVYPNFRFSRFSDRFFTVDRIERAGWANVTLCGTLKRNFSSDQAKDSEWANLVFLTIRPKFDEWSFFRRSDWRCWASQLSFFNYADNAKFFLSIRSTELGEPNFWPFPLIVCLMSDLFSADWVEGAGWAVGPAVWPQRAGAPAARGQQAVGGVRKNSPGLKDPPG